MPLKKNGDNIKIFKTPLLTEKLLLTYYDRLDTVRFLYFIIIFPKITETFQMDKIIAPACMYMFCVYIHTQKMFKKGFQTYKIDIIHCTENYVVSRKPIVLEFFNFDNASYFCDFIDYAR